MDVKRLLSKKGWTGEETGKALIYSLISEYRQTLDGSTDPKPLFPMEKIREMLHGFRASANDLEQYNRYINLQNWIKQYQAVANAYFQRFQSCINEFIADMRAAQTAENENRYIERLPRIMTQKQYEELRAKRIEETFVDNDGADYNYNLFYLINTAIQHYAEELKKHPTKANPLKALKKLYLKTPVEDKAIIAAYNKAVGNGYYQLPDGTRSDKVTPEEWEKRIAKVIPLRTYLNNNEGFDLENDTGKAVFDETLKFFRANHMGKEYHIHEDDINIVWYTYEEATDGLTLWDLIEAHGDGKAYLDEYYTAFSGEEKLTPEEFTAQIYAFKREFPGLLEAILKEFDALDFTITEANGEGERPLSAIPVEEWETTVISFRQLYEKDFPGFREWVEADYHIFEGDKRALVNGIAILRPSDLLASAPINGRTSASIDENGYFIEPEGRKSISVLFGLEQYTPENPEHGDAIDRVERNRATLEDSLRWIIGFDKALDLIAKEIDIPDFTIFRVDSERCIARTEAVNGTFDILYTDIQGIDYPDKGKKELKLQALRDVFYPIKAKEITIPEGHIKKAAKMLSGLDAFGDSRGGTAPGWNFLALLTGVEGGGDE
jgi:hypothetical protein